MSDSYGNHIIQYDKSYSLCTGCHSCEMMCGLVHTGACSPTNGCIHVELDSTSSMMYQVLSCQHCDDHPCYDACPLKGKAMCLDEERNIAYVNTDNCVGCGKCMRSCKFRPSRITVLMTKDRSRRKARKCDLCRTRSEGPACIEHCSAGVLGLSGDPLPYEK